MRLDTAGILALVPADEAEDISPIFAVRKKFDATRGVWSLRLLFDRRRRNERERHLHGASRDLPHAACFLDIVLEAGEHIEIDASDLECFYYTARVSDKRAARNVFGRPLLASKFAKCACYNPALGNRLDLSAHGHNFGVELFFPYSTLTEKNRQSWVRARSVPHPIIIPAQTLPYAPLLCAYPMLLSAGACRVHHPRADGLLHRRHRRDGHAHVAHRRRRVPGKCPLLSVTVCYRTVTVRY